MEIQQMTVKYYGSLRAGPSNHVPNSPQRSTLARSIQRSNDPLPPLQKPYVGNIRAPVFTPRAKQRCHQGFLSETGHSTHSLFLTTERSFLNYAIAIPDIPSQHPNIPLGRPQRIGSDTTTPGEHLVFPSRRITTSTHQDGGQIPLPRGVRLGRLVRYILLYSGAGCAWHPTPRRSSPC